MKSRKILCILAAFCLDADREAGRAREAAPGFSSGAGNSLLRI